jgi:hypothetical protein
MGDSPYNVPFSSDDDPLWRTTEMLQGLISPASAQSLVAPPAGAASKTASATAEKSAALATPNHDQHKAGPRIKIRHGLAAYFSGGIGNKEIQPKTGQEKAAFLFRRTGQLQPSKRTTKATSHVNQRHSETPRKASEKRTQQARANTDEGTRNAVQAETAYRLPDRSQDPRYVKVQSRGRIGYLPKSNLQRAKQRDETLKVLE